MADIRHSIQIAARPDAVYPLVASGRGFSEWWAADVTETASGVELGFFNRATVYRLRKSAEQSPGNAEWVCDSGDEWKDTRIVFRLEGRGDGTVLGFIHGGWRAETDYFVSCNTTWGELMYQLKAAAEGKSRGPLFLPGALAY